MYRQQRRGLSRLLFFFNFILAGIVCSLFLVFALQLEPVNRRVAALPFYVRTYWNQWRPKAALPPPPDVAEVDTDALLQTRQEVVPAAVQPDEIEGITGATVSGSGANPAEATLAETNLLEVAPIANEMQLTGFNHEWQTWNNCGPVTIAMNLSYYGHTGTQIESAQFLKPNADDKNVNPDELAAYARLQGLEAMTRVGGDVALLKRLLSNGFPVIVETWLDPKDNGGLGHYRLFTGYNEVENLFMAEDSLHGSSIGVEINQFDAFWQVFNRKYVVVYHADQSALVHAILQEAAIENLNYEQALLTAQNEARLNPANAYAWFNIGTNYTNLGELQLAAGAFDEARRLGLPYRMLWYQFEMFETYLQVARYQEVIDLTTVTINETGGLEELYYYRGRAQLALNQSEAAVADFQAALDYNPNFGLAAQVLQELGEL